jgi:hypothetical protein
MNAATPCAAVEAVKVIPDRRRSQETVRHARDKDAGRISFPLDVTDTAVVGDGELEAELEAANPGT